LKDYLKDRENKRLTEAREARSHEVQMALITAAQNKDKNNIVLVPPPAMMQNSDPPAEDEDKGEQK